MGTSLAARREGGEKLKLLFKLPSKDGDVHSSEDNSRCNSNPDDDFSSGSNTKKQKIGSIAMYLAQTTMIRVKSMVLHQTKQLTRKSLNFMMDSLLLYLITIVASYPRQTSKEGYLLSLCKASGP